MKNKKQIDDKFWIAVGIVVIVVLIYVWSFFVSFDKEDGPDYGWLSDNCECLEHERLKCPEGFELYEEERFCKGDRGWTNVLLGCSKYNCSDEIVEVN